MFSSGSSGSTVSQGVVGAEWENSLFQSEYSTCYLNISEATGALLHSRKIRKTTKPKVCVKILTHNS